MYGEKYCGKENGKESVKNYVLYVAYKKSKLDSVVNELNS